MTTTNPLAIPLEARICYSKHQSNDFSFNQQQFMKNISYKQAIGS